MPSVQFATLLGQAQRHGPWRDKQSLQLLRAWVTQFTQVTGGAVGVSIVSVEMCQTESTGVKEVHVPDLGSNHLLFCFDVFFGWVVVSVHELRC